LTTRCVIRIQVALKQLASSRTLPLEKSIEIAKELLSVEFRDLKSAGFSAVMLRDHCQATAKQLKMSGFTAADVMQMYAIDCAGLLALGYSRDELLQAGFGYGHIINSGDPRYTFVILFLVSFSIPLNQQISHPCFYDFDFRIKNHTLFTKENVTLFFAASRVFCIRHFACA
jgi:hypothetical protein